MDNIQNSFELRYYQAVCQIQDDYIKGKTSKKEYEQKLEIERLKQIIHLTEKVEKLKRNIEIEFFNTQIISNVSENPKKYRYKKTGEIYNGQIYINGECCTDGHGNEVVYGF